MNGRELTHAARPVEWKERVAKCRSSGKTIRKWCEEHGIAYKTYNRWEKEVLSKATEQISAAKESTVPDFVELPMSQEGRNKAVAGHTVAARLHSVVGEVEIFVGADRETLQTLLWVLQHAE